MPVKSAPRERPFIEMLLSAYERGAWKDAVRDWVEERQDGAVAGGCLNASGCRHSSHNHLGSASRLELAFKIRCCQHAPASLGDDNIARLLIQLWQEFGPSLGKRRVAARTLLRPVRRPSRHIDQHDW